MKKALERSLTGCAGTAGTPKYGGDEGTVAMDPENRSADDPPETREISDEEFEEVLDRCIERDLEILEELAKH